MAVATLFEDLLDQYKIEQHLGEKRYTDRFEAYDVDNDRLVWIEILRDGYAENASFAGRFVSRAQVLAQVRNPNIAQVLHVGKAAGGAPYVAQESIDGYSLSYRLEQLAQKNTPVNPVYALSLIRQLARALLLTERLELFHYALQPDNIYLKNVALPTEDSVMLIDLFVPPEKFPKEAPAGEEGGDEGYLSPEQRAGRGMTAAGHVYSLGVIIFRLLAGRMPDGPLTLNDNIAGRVFGRASALKNERPDLAPATYQLVDRCLQKDPRRRINDIESFLAALDTALKAEENKLKSEAGHLLMNNRRVGWLLPLLAGILLLAVALLAFQGLRGRNLAPNGLLAATQAIGVVDNVFLSEPATPTPQPTATVSEASTTPVSVSNPTQTNTSIKESTAGTTAANTATPSSTPTIAASPEATTAVETATLKPVPLARVVHNMVNLRRGPGIEYAVFGNVTGGEVLEVLAWNGREEFPWLLVITEDRRIAWIAATVVQLDQDLTLTNIEVAATIPPTPPSTATIASTPGITSTPGTITPTLTPGDGLGGVISTVPPDDPTDIPQPTSTLPEPTRTPPPTPTR